MEAMRQSWTDERLDEFRESVNRQFASVDKRFDETNRRMDAGFTQLNERLDGLHRVLLQTMVAFGVGLLGLIAALIGVIATQL